MLPRKCVGGWHLCLRHHRRRLVPRVVAPEKLAAQLQEKLASLPEKTLVVLQVLDNTSFFARVD
jgi:hypothetical protein